MYYFIGIKGAGMSALAVILKKLGNNVSGSDLEVKTESGKEYKIQVMQSTLPSVYIDLTDTELNEIHLDKNKVYYGNSIYISSLQKEYNVSEEQIKEPEERQDYYLQLQNMTTQEILLFKNKKED